MDRIKARNVALRCSVVIVAIGMLVYVVQYCLGTFATTLTTLPAQEITDYTVLSAEVYIFRDEQVVSSGTNAPVRYLYRDGERVPKNETYAVAYLKSDADADEVAALQDKLDDIHTQIVLLQDSKAGSLIASLEQSKDEVKDSYYRVLESLAAGTYLLAGTESENLLSYLSTYGMLAEKQDSEAMIAGLKSRQSGLISAWGGTAKEFKTAKSTNFYHKCDGYEAVFDYSRVMSMTLEEFYAMTESAPASVAGAVGKTVDDHTWYAAIPMDEDSARRFDEGDVYTFTFTDNDGQALPLTLERKIISTGKQDSVLVFSCDRTPEEFSFLRNQRVQTVVESITGYRVPTEAIVTYQGERGVYILDDSHVEFRRVTVVREGTGYYIVQTYEQDQESGAGMAKYLQRNDLIITGGRDLYVGKRYG